MICMDTFAGTAWVVLAAIFGGLVLCTVITVILTWNPKDKS